jgi:hypothetical protein
MTRIKMLLGTACIGALAVLGCSQSGPGTSTGSGGSSSGGGNSGSGGASSQGGSSGSGGVSSGGITGKGGSGSGGNTPSGGAAGQGTGGAGGDGTGGSSSPGGSGGAASGGASGGAGAGGTGGKAAGGASGSGSGGVAAGGTQGKGGAAGAGGATGGSSGGISAADIVPDLAKGFYWEGTCAGTITVDGHNCPMSGTGSASCPTNGRDMDQPTLKVGGDSTKKYTVNIEVRGVIGTRCYQGGTAASTAAIKDNDYNNWWYAGGTPYNATGWWNTYELHVSPSTGDASKDVYYFNNSSNTPSDGGDCEREASYLVGYTASFKVMGGGSMLFRIHDNNCKAIQNCGAVTDKSAPCSPRTVDLSKMTVQPPSSSPAAKQPPMDGTWYPQWMWIVATSVTAG